MGWLNRRKSRINSKTSPATGVGNFSEPKQMSQAGECAKSNARRSLRFVSQSGAGGTIRLRTLWLKSRD